MTPWRRLVATGAVLACAAGGALVFPEMRFESRLPDARAIVRLELSDAGAGRAQLDTAVARALEARLRRIDGVEDFESRIAEGRARIDVHVSAARARRAFEHIGALLRDEAARPAVFDVPRIALVDPTRARAHLAVRSSSATPETLVTWAEDRLVPPLRLLPAVAGVNPLPAVRTGVDVLPDQRRFGALGLTILDVAQALRAATGTGVDALSALPVRLPAGDSVPLSSLAQIVVHPASIEDELAILIEARAGVDTPALSREIEAHLEWLRANGQMPAGVSVALAPDRDAGAHTVRIAVAVLLSGLLLSALVVGFACDARTALGLVGSSLLAVAGAAALLTVAGRMLTPVTLSAFTVAIVLVSAGTILRRHGWLPESRQALALAAAGAFWALPAVWPSGGSPGLQEWFLALVVSTAIASLLAGILFVPATRPCAGAFARLEQRMNLLAGRAMAGPRAAVGVGALLLIPLLVWVAMQPWTEAGVDGGSREWRVRLYGDDAEALAAAGAEALERLRNLGRPVTATSSAATLALRWHAEPYPEQAQHLGLEADGLERILRLSLDGVVLRELGEGFRRSALRLQLPENERLRADVVERLLVAGELDHRPQILMRGAAQVERRWDFAETRRDARGDYVELAGEVRDIVLGDLAAAVDEVLEGLPAVNDVRWTGRVAEMRRAAAILLAAGVAGSVFAVALVGALVRRWRALSCGLFGVLAALPGVAVGVMTVGALAPAAAAAGVTLAGFGAGAAVLLAGERARPVDGAPLAAGVALILGLIPLASLVSELWLGLFIMTFLSGLCLLLPAVALTVPPCYFLAGSRGMK
jgi:multidrug efflux pump subunit AcrB